jgi:hypothetical protein
VIATARTAPARTPLRIPFRTALVGGAVLVGALALTGCAASSEPAPPAETVTVTPTPDATDASAPAPEEDGGADAVATFPATCRDVVDPADYDAIFGGTPLNDPAFTEVPEDGVVDESVVVDGPLAGGTRLFCVWADPQADITSLRLSMGDAAAAGADAYLASLASQDYTCEERLQGDWCQRIGADETYPVEIAHTFFVRDDVYISVDQANFPTDGLLDDIVARVWS